ncbi:MAG: PrsW family glutamic-type intramembrane protease [Spirochaetia bacterium]
MSIPLAIFLLLLIDAAAVTLWVLVLARLDRYRRIKETRKKVIKFFFLGCLSVPLALGLYEVFMPISGIFWYDPDGIYYFFDEFFVTGPVEELSKFLVFYLFAVRLKAIKEPKDGLLLAGSVALGFAAVENFKYGWYYGFDVILIRSFTTILGHILYSSLWGAAAGIVLFETDKRDRHRYRPLMFAALVPASFAHGLNNYIVYTSDKSAVMLDVILFAGFILMYRYIGRHTPYADPKTAVLKRAVENHPRDYELVSRLGKAEILRRNYDAAAGHFLTCYRQRPESQASGFYYGISLLCTNRHDEGIKVLKKGFPLLTGEYPTPETQAELPPQIAARKKKLASLVRNRLDELPLPGDVRSDISAALGLDKTTEEGSRPAGTANEAPGAAQGSSATSTPSGTSPGLVYREGRTRKTSAERKRVISERLVTVKRSRYVDRRGVPYRRVLDEKTRELRGLMGSS